MSFTGFRGFDFQSYLLYMDSFAFCPLIRIVVILSKHKFLFSLAFFHLLNVGMIHMAKECQERKHLGRIIWDAVIPDLDHPIHQSQVREQPQRVICQKFRIPGYLEHR